jgi:hypothetical protein
MNGLCKGFVLRKRKRRSLLLLGSKAGSDEAIDGMWHKSCPLFWKDTRD